MSMRGKRRAATLVVCAVSTWAATGCGNNTAQAPTPGPTHTVDVSPPANPVHDAAAAQVLKTLAAYYTLYNKLSQNPNDDLTAINTVASGQEITAFTADIQDDKDRGLHAVGDVTVANSKITDLSITPSNASAAADLCLDVSKVQGVDAQGKPANASGRLVHQLGRFSITNSIWPDPTGWRVSKTELRNLPCT
jgi:hypothetical protein